MCGTKPSAVASEAVSLLLNQGESVTDLELSYTDKYTWPKH